MKTPDFQDFNIRLILSKKLMVRRNWESREEQHILGYSHQFLCHTEYGLLIPTLCLLQSF